MFSFNTQQVHIDLAMLDHGVSIAVPGARNWVILRGGRRYIYNKKDEMINGLSPSV